MTVFTTLKGKQLNYLNIKINFMTYNDIFQKIVVGIEGPYSNDKNDPGGVTVFGLTRKADPDWQGWAIVNQYQNKSGYPKNLPYDVLRAMALPYYKAKYWDFAQLDKFPIQIAAEVFDQAVNLGNSVAIRNLQRALNVLNHRGKDYPDLVKDGIFGSKTLAAVLANKNPDAVAKFMNSYQGEDYTELAEGNDKFEDFTNGWAERL